MRENGISAHFCRITPPASEKNGEKKWNRSSGHSDFYDNLLSARWHPPLSLKVIWVMGSSWTKINSWLLTMYVTIETGKEQGLKWSFGARKESIQRQSFSSFPGSARLHDHSQHVSYPYSNGKCLTGDCTFILSSKSAYVWLLFV